MRRFFFGRGARPFGGKWARRSISDGGEAIGDRVVDQILTDCFGPHTAQLEIVIRIAIRIGMPADFNHRIRRTFKCRNQFIDHGSSFGGQDGAVAFKGDMLSSQQLIQTGLDLGTGLMRNRWSLGRKEDRPRGSA